MSSAAKDLDSVDMEPVARKKSCGDDMLSKDSAGACSDPVDAVGCQSQPGRSKRVTCSPKKPAITIVEPHVNLRSRKRKSLHPTALLALQATLQAESESPAQSKEANEDPASHNSASSSVLHNESLSSPPTQPVSKRLRAREVKSTPLPAKRPRQLRNTSSGSVAVRHADQLSGSPPPDFEFTGSSSNLIQGSTVVRLTGGVANGPKSCLKSEAGASSKHHRLAFVSELGEVSESIESTCSASGSAISLRPIPAEAVEFDKKKIPGEVQSKELLETLGVHVGIHNTYWHQSNVKGHAGVAILSKIKPLQVMYGVPGSSIGSFAEKGHVITAEYEKFFLVNAYVPNSSAKLVNLTARLAWDIGFRKFLKDLQTRKPVVVAGDLNCALTEIDLANPKSNIKNAGFTPEERASLRKTLEELDMVDVFRQRNPSIKGCYTFWSSRTSARARNVGWRLDYFLTSRTLFAGVVDMLHLVDVTGSDHCPIMLLLNIESVNDDD